MRVLVVGNLGYVGYPLVRKLFSDAKYEVIGLDSEIFKGDLFSSEPDIISLGRNQFVGDVRDFNYGRVGAVDAVVYLAAISNDPMASRFKDPTYMINCFGAVRALRAARSLGATSFVFASSCSVYGQGDSTPRLESAELDPLSDYAWSKVDAEKYLELENQGALTLTCLRFATACGFSQMLRLDLVLNDFVVSAVKNRKIDVLSDGKSKRPLISVKDMAEAICWAIHRESRAENRTLTVNVGSNQWNFVISDLANAVSTLVEGTVVAFKPNGKNDPRSYHVNFDLYESLNPAHSFASFEEVVEELVFETRRAMNKLSGSLRDSKYVRLKSIEEQLTSGRLDHSLRVTLSR